MSSAGSSRVAAAAVSWPSWGKRRLGARRRPSGAALLEAVGRDLGLAEKDCPAPARKPILSKGIGPAS